MESFDWQKLFLGKDVHEQVILFNKTMQIFSITSFQINLLTVMIKILPWIYDEIKTLIKRNNWFY